MLLKNSIFWKILSFLAASSNFNQFFSIKLGKTFQQICEKTFQHLFSNFLADFSNLLAIFQQYKSRFLASNCQVKVLTFQQLFSNFLATFQQFFSNFLATFFILEVYCFLATFQQPFSNFLATFLRFFSKLSFQHGFIVKKTLLKTFQQGPLPKNPC